jgi:protein involved in polysaccharide export with SLBB domain
MHRLIGILACAAILAAFCISGASAQTASALGVPSGSAASAGSTPPSASRQEVPGDYHLGPTDKIRVVVYGEDALNTPPLGEYIVGADGMVSLPLVGDVKAGGLTVDEFRDKVVQAYRNGYLKDPKIAVEVETARPFYILGEVKLPGQYPYQNGMTILNAVATAGGFTYRAVTDKVFIKHAAETDEHEYDLDSTTELLPGDTVRIEERWF